MTPTPAGRATIVIPAFQPTTALADLVGDLRAGVDRPIIIVDDGSSAACRPLFARVALDPNVVVLSHASNVGKGQALKTAFNHFLLHAPPDATGVVTADADGQHLVGDVRRWSWGRGGSRAACRCAAAWATGSREACSACSPAAVSWTHRRVCAAFRALFSAN